MNDQERDRLVDAFLATLRAENTRSTYARALAHFRRAMDGRLPVEVELSMIQRWYERTLRTQSPNTARMYMMVLSSFFSWMDDMGLGHAPPGWRRFLRGVKTDESQARRALSEEEIRRLLRVASEGPTGRRDVLLVEVGLTLWLRRGELAAMRFEHFRRTGEHVVLVLPKTKRGVPDRLPVPPLLYERILRLGESDYGEVSGPVWRPYIRERYRKRTMADESIGYVLGRLGERAGIADLTPHVLRHTGITMAVRRGLTVDRVQRMARHRSTNTTMRYVHDVAFMEQAPALVLWEEIRQLEP